MPDGRILSGPLQDENEINTMAIASCGGFFWLQGSGNILVGAVKAADRVAREMMGL